MQPSSPENTSNPYAVDNNQSEAETSESSDEYEEPESEEIVEIGLGCRLMTRLDNLLDYPQSNDAMTSALYDMFFVLCRESYNYPEEQRTASLEKDDLLARYLEEYPPLFQPATLKSCSEELKRYWPNTQKEGPKRKQKRDDINRDRQLFSVQ
jgi:hypothetical protein